MSLPSPRERMRAGRYGPGERSGLPCGRAGRSALGEGRRARTAQTGRDHLPDHAVFARSNQIRLLEWDSETLYRHVAETVKVFSWGFRPLAERWNGPSHLPCCPACPACATGTILPSVSPRARGAAKDRPQRYPPLADYALIGDCPSAALVHRSGSIDWCCMPRFDSGSCFGRLLDWDRGGFCSIVPIDGEVTSSRRYLEGTLVLETTFRCGGGEARLLDCFTMRRGGAREPYRQLLRVVEGMRGRTDLRLDLHARFDYAEVRPWIRQLGVRLYSAIGGNDGLLVFSDADIAPGKDHDLQATFSVRPGERVRLSIQAMAPEVIDDGKYEPFEPEELDRRLEETIRWWERWSSKGRLEGPFEEGAKRSAIVLKALTHAPTGAMVASPSTSLPESPKGSRNWDYRFSWVRDSSFAVRSLAELGHDAEADGYRRFIERSSAGNAEDLQVMFGVGGERRLNELEITNLEGYRGAKPVRTGNAAARQNQLDVYGDLLDLAWRWHRRGHSPDDD